MIERFSEKQLRALGWWCEASPYRKRDAIICDGAVRSGKTLCLSVSFIIWSMSGFNKMAFALCGKTIHSLRRNVILPLTAMIGEMGYEFVYRFSRGEIEISRGGRSNLYYLYGGKDEGSAAMIQGVTLAGVLMDEVALMPRSFVEQALARCSVEGAKFWFNCNPEHPGHWFYNEWIKRTDERNALYLHFTMEDNPSLSKEVRERYERMYTGAFYQRYIQGKWVQAHGAVYPMFSRQKHVVENLPECVRFVISCDYGTVNPASFGLWGENNDSGKWYRFSEYYHDSRTEGFLRTDEEYADEIERLADGKDIEAVVVDPSAVSFILCLKRRGKFNVVPAKNSVIDGIRIVSAALKDGKLLFHERCKDCIREFGLYRWNLSASMDTPHKENDHAMDDMRYFAAYAFGGTDKQGGGFCALSAKRK